jgi:DNA polymerase/3'-5' exonuclease PolX
MLNQLIIENFKKLIKLIQYETNALTDKKQKTINQFRINSLIKSLKIISKLDYQIKNINQISNIKGIGKGTLDRVDEILRTQTLQDLDVYDKTIAKYEHNENIIQNLMSVIGIGRTIATNLIKEYNIKSVEQLIKLSDANKIQLNDKIKLGLKYVGKFQGMIPRKEIDQIYDYIQEITDQYDKNMFITICGSYRRNLPISSDIDILLSNLNIITMDDIVLNNHILKSYVEYLHKKNLLVDDLTDSNIKTKYMGFGKYGKNNIIRRVDIRFIPMISYFPALLYFTGSYELNQQMRLQAKKLGYKLNEYGLYDKNEQMIITLSEQEIFQKLEMKYLSPNER